MAFATNMAGSHAFVGGVLRLLLLTCNDWMLPGQMLRPQFPLRTGVIILLCK